MLGLWIGALIARWGFWLLLAYGWWSAEVSTRRAIVFAVLWFAVLIGSSFVAAGTQVFTASVALLDIALVLFIFKSDIKIS